jgi:hypothetical protein
MPRVLALDPGTNAGAAWGDPGGKPKSTIIRLDSKMSPQRRFCLLEDRVRNLIATFEIDEVVVESRFVQHDPKRFDINALRLGYGWEAAIMMACEREGIGSERLHWVTADQWRKSAFGHAKAPKTIKDWKERRDWLKGEAILLCGQRGWAISSDDESEAALIWAHGCELVKPRSTEKLLPLFELASL